METKHTPGPWIARHSGYGDADVVSAPIPTKHEPFTVTLGTRLSWSDAFLMAEAPAMLAALEGLFKHCVMVHKHWGEGDNTREAEAVKTAALATIARAKGEA